MSKYTVEVVRGSDGILFASLKEGQAQTENHLDKDENLVEVIPLEGRMESLASLACDALSEGQFGDELEKLFDKLLSLS